MSDKMSDDATSKTRERYFLTYYFGSLGLKTAAIGLTIGGLINKDINCIASAAVLAYLSNSLSKENLKMNEVDFYLKQGDERNHIEREKNEISKETAKGIVQAVQKLDKLIDLHTKNAG